MYLLYSPFVRGYARHDLRVRGDQNIETEAHLNDTEVLKAVTNDMSS